MLNVLNQQQRGPQGDAAPGLTRAAYRVSQALLHLPTGLQAALGLRAADAMCTIDQGLRELTRRLAWQFAASFAKRLPHGSVGCSNVSLAGQFMDFGMSHFLPSYRRPADALQDPWALRTTLGSSASAVDAYLAAQARRKNAVLPELLRDEWFRIAGVARVQEEEFLPAAAQSMLAGAIGRARRMLADLAVDLPGGSGVEQIQFLARQQVSANDGGH